MRQLRAGLSMMAVLLVAGLAAAEPASAAPEVSPVVVEQLEVVQLVDFATGGEMAVQQMPSIGRIVRYTERGSGDVRPAIVVGVLNRSWVDLNIFTSLGISPSYRAEHGEAGEQGKWHWPDPSGATVPVHVRSPADVAAAEFQVIKAPALCLSCGTVYTSPTTGLLGNRCHCGGELKTQQGGV